MYRPTIFPELIVDYLKRKWEDAQKSKQAEAPKQSESNADLHTENKQEAEKQAYISSIHHF